MEDSYAVHRRRKAAARRPEKTAEARREEGNYTSSANGRNLKSRDSISMDEEEERRARMERMVEDTERLERAMGNEDRSRSKSRQPLSEEPLPVSKSRAMSAAVNRNDKLDIKQEDVLKSREFPVPGNTELFEQKQEQRWLLDQRPSMKATKRSEETPDNTELRRRMSSPESNRTRSDVKHSTASRPIKMSQHDNEKSERKSSKKRVSSRHRYEDPSDDDESPDTIENRSRRRSSSKPAKKQIIPLSNSSLMADVAKAKWAYTPDELIDEDDYDDFEHEDEDDGYSPWSKRVPFARRRKTSFIYPERDDVKIAKVANESSSSWFSWIPFFGKKKEKIDETSKNNDNQKETRTEKPYKEASTAKEKAKEVSAKTTDQEASGKVTFRELLGSVRDIGGEFREYCRQNAREVQTIIELRNLCIVEAILVVIVCGLGGLVFRFTEGAFESFYKCGVKRVKRDFLDSLWNYSHNMKEDDWKSMARRKLMEFEEQLHTAHEAGVQTYSGQRSWSFLNAMVYCLTIISTIGYGHISPSTTTGRALTIIYAIFGIPMFLIVLADFGKLFTRGIKFLWAFVRRLYYTGSCRKVRRTVPMQEMMKGVQMVYDLATFRRSSQMTPEELAEMQRQQQSVLNVDGSTPQQASSPATPALSTFEIDDEFNLPISVAITILVLYIFIGALIFNIFEDWSFFESFYFVFISMSTIGFGDFVPQDPLYMMLSIIYLIFGLALTSMCINVVQVMLADQFKQASQKIGASIGFQVSEEDGSLKPVPEPVEVAEVHSFTGIPSTATETDSKDKVAPTVKQEDVEV